MYDGPETADVAPSKEQTPMAKLDQAIGQVGSHADDIASAVRDIREYLLGPRVKDEGRDRPEGSPGVINGFTWRSKNTDETLCQVLNDLHEIKSQVATG